MTALGPIAGGFLIEWTWRAIFWINIPVAVIALVLIAISKPPNEARQRPGRGRVRAVGLESDQPVGLWASKATSLLAAARLLG